MDDLSEILKQITDYIKNPDCPTQKIKSFDAILKTLAVILVVAFILNFSFVLIIGILEGVGLFSMDDHAITKMFDELSPIMIIIAAVVLAPVFEELIFRAPLTLFCRFKNDFEYFFYGFALVFGYMHIANYELNGTIWLLSPILVAPQILLGLLLGYIRVNIGLVYSILFHAVYNAIIVIPGVIFHSMGITP